MKQLISFFQYGCENSLIPRVEEVNETLKNSTRNLFVPEVELNNKAN